MWMYRQATGMNQSHVRVLTQDYQNRERFPATNIAVDVVDAWRVPAGRWQRYYHYLSNWRTGFFRGTKSEIEWWRAKAAAERPSVALCHYGPIALRMLPLFRQLGIPLVAHFNGFDLPKQPHDTRYARRLKRAFPALAGCVVVAPHMREWLLNSGLPEEKLRYIPYGVPLEDFKADNLADVRQCNFLIVGRLVEKKQPDLTIRAFAKCVEKFPDCRLTIVGDGPLRSECERLVSDLGVAQWIEFLGACSAEEVKSLLSKSSVFVQHSVTASNGDMEGWPVAIAEAAASGLPVISTRHASIPDQVLHGVTGLLCDELDWKSMADHMMQLAGDSSTRKEMGLAAREHMKQFDSSRQIAALEEYLHTVAAGKSDHHKAVS